MKQLKNLTIIISLLTVLISFGLALNIPVHSSSEDILSSSSESSIGTLDLPKDTEEIQENQRNIVSLENEIKILREELQNTTEEVLQLESEIQGTNALLEVTREQISNLQSQAQKNQELINNSTNIDQQELLTKANETLNSQIKFNTDLIKSKTAELDELQNQLKDKISNKNSLESLISQKEELLNEKEVEVDQRIKNLGISLSKEFGEWIVYILLIFAYWMLYRLSSKKIQAKIKRPLMKKLVKNTVKFILLSLTFLTFAYALIGRFQIIQQVLTILAFISLAISLALKDFVASFFAFVLLVSAKQYAVGDIISFAGVGDKKVKGRVIRVGWFLTNIEIYDSEDNPVGEITSFPNNKILEKSVSNLTKNNYITWFVMDIVLADQINLEKSKDIITKNVETAFQQALEKKEIYLDGRISNMDKKYKPKINYSMQAEGASIKITYPVRAGNINKSKDLLIPILFKGLKENNIKFKKIVIDNP